jgi:hypothetical protein
MSELSSEKPVQKRQFFGYVFILFVIYAFCWAGLLTYFFVQLTITGMQIPLYPVFAMMLAAITILGSILGSIVLITVFTFSLILSWGILTGMTMNACRLRRNVRHVCAAMLFSGFYTVLLCVLFFSYFAGSSVNILDAALWLGGLNAIAVLPFALVVFPTENNRRLERKVAAKILQTGWRVTSHVGHQAVERKGFFSYRWLIPIVFVFPGSLIFMGLAVFMQPDSAFPDDNAMVEHIFSFLLLGLAASAITGLAAMLMRLRKKGKDILLCLLSASVCYAIFIYLPLNSSSELNRASAHLNHFLLLAAWWLTVLISAWLSFKKPPPPPSDISE